LLFLKIGDSLLTFTHSSASPFSCSAIVNYEESVYPSIIGR
jgi:hypothetical protein